MIYLASPYSHKNPAIRNARYHAAFAYATYAMSKGEVIFSPIVYGHEFAINGYAQTDHLWWQRFNERILLAATELRVLQLIGWDDSLGVTHEIEFAERHLIPITYEAPL